MTLIGCGGAQTPGHYRDDEANYRYTPPAEAWQPLKMGDDNDLAWHHRQDGSILQVNASCSPDHDIPLRALTEHLLIGFTDRENLEANLIDLDGREALQTRIRAKLDGVSREVSLTVLKKNGCVYDFALIATPSSYERSATTYRHFLQSFHAVESSDE